AAAVAAGGIHSLALAEWGPPFIATQLADRLALVRGKVQFHVTATGGKPLTYQWRFGGAELPGATDATLSLAYVQPGQAGLYSVIVSNSHGVVNSSDCMLTVLPLRISSSPQNRSVLVGETVMFGVTVQSIIPFTRQWRFNGSDLPGATGSTLSLTNVQINQAGAYSVAVSNQIGGAVSSEASLSVGVVAAWGGNASGQTNVPPGLSNVVAMAAGGTHSLALNADGTVL